MKRFQGGLVSKAHRFLYHSTLGSRVFEKRDVGCRVQGAGCRVRGAGCRVQGARCRVQG